MGQQVNITTMHDKESSIIISLGKVYSILHEKFLQYRANLDPVSSLLDEECNVDNITKQTIRYTCSKERQKSSQRKQI